MNTPHTWSDSPIHEQIRSMNTPTPRTDEFERATCCGNESSLKFARKLERKLTELTEQMDEAREQLTAVTEQRNTLAENDLKAIHEVEKVLESDHKYAYDDYSFVLYEKHGNTVSFTAAQRIEALVCIMKKWTLDDLGWPTDDLPETTMNTPHTWSDSPIHEQIRTMNTDTPETDAAYKNHAADMHDHIPLDFARKLQRELDEAVNNYETAQLLSVRVGEQRDRLAVALRECREDSVELLGERDWWQRESRLDYQERYQETRDNVTRADEALQSLTPNQL